MWDINEYKTVRCVRYVTTKVLMQQTVCIQRHSAMIRCYTCVVSQKQKKKEQLRALLASWLQDFLQARGRSMLAMGRGFLRRWFFRCTPDEDKAVSPKPCPAVGRKQRGCSTCRATASSYGMERWWALCSPRSQWWVWMWFCALPIFCIWISSRISTLKTSPFVLSRFGV